MMEKKAQNLPIIPANARELHIIEFVAGLHAQTAQGEEILKERLAAIPGGVARLSNGEQPNRQGAGWNIRNPADEDAETHGQVVRLRRSDYTAQAHD